MMNESDLRTALSLDDDELTFLRAARLPAQLMARIMAESRVTPRARLIELLWIVVPAALGYAGWLFVAPTLGRVGALARQSGITAILAAQVIDVAWNALDLFASIVEAASAVPGFNAPLILVSLLAAAAYTLGLGLPSVRRRPAAV